MNVYVPLFTIQMTKQQAQEYKEKGNKLFAEEKFSESIQWYNKAIAADPSDHVLFSNRSAAHLGAKEFEKALESAEQCIKINRKWPKGYFRKGLALMSLNRFTDAINTFKEGLTHDPKNVDLQTKIQEATKVAASHKEKSKPQGLAAKLEGNDHFKDSRYEHAIESYTRALQTIEEIPEKATVFSNRAACFYQLRSYEEVVRDCTEALTLVPNHVKSLLRRGLAYDSLEKPKLALQDLQQVLIFEPNTAIAITTINRIKTSQARFEQSGGK